MQAFLKSMLHGVSLLAIGHVLLAVAVVRAGEPSELDWDTWERMPVFDNGRLMPLDTFARSVVAKICGRENPRLEVDGRRRKFRAAELLFAWLAEPQRWEDVPMLLAEHEQLRTGLLGLETRDGQGTRLKHVSLRQLERARRFREWLGEVEDKEAKARREKKEYRPSNLEERIKRLSRAYSTFRLLTFEPDDPRGTESRFFDKVVRAAGVWNEVKRPLETMGQLDGQEALESAVAQTSEAFRELIALSEQQTFPLGKTEPLVVSLCRSTARVAEHFAAQKRRLMSDPPELEQEQLRHVRTRMHTLASRTAELARLADAMHLALYDNVWSGEGSSLRLIPALNAAALDGDRQESEDMQPWLNFQTLMYGSDDVLRRYPRAEVQRVREAFEEAKKAYVDREDPKRRQHFGAAMDRLASAVRSLGEQIEPARRRLPVRKQDETQLADTAYPPPDYTDVEIFYNRFRPFLWSWVVNLLALALYAASFGVVRKPMFWVATCVLVAGQVLTCYGLGLRAYIRGWGPVTGMFETVVFVALCVALLGVWFAILPLVWPGLKHAWRLTAVPLTWEATPPSEGPMAGSTQQRLDTAGWVLLAPRVALAVTVFVLMACMDYGPGGKTPIAPLWPRVAVGSSVPGFDNLLVWLVGMCVLIPSVWYLPRAILMAVLSVVTIPTTLRRQGARESLEQVYARKAFVVVGAAVGFLAAYLGYWAPETVLRKEFTPLVAALRDNFWLTFHVLPITASYGAGALAWGLANISLAYYLFGRYRQGVGTAELTGVSGFESAGAAGPTESRIAGPAEAEGSDPPGGDQGKPGGAALRRAPEVCRSLARFTYKATQVAVLLLIAGTILGALWADVVWGRPWSWDRKEVWSLISILVYLTILHARYTGRSGDFGLAVGSVLGFTAIVMAWYGVNYVLPGGLHSYGKGDGGQWEVGVVILCNWVFLLLAGIRYRIETRRVGT